SLALFLGQMSLRVGQGQGRGRSVIRCLNSDVGAPLSIRYHIMRQSVRMIATSALVVFLAATTKGQERGAAAARTRYFPAQKCQFTLPAKGWSWADRPLGNAFVAAESTGGLLAQATCAPAEAWTRMDERAAEDFELSLARSSRGQFKKRNASYVPFH